MAQKPSLNWSLNIVAVWLYCCFDNFITAFTVGRATLAGASLVGLGALCYYGLGLSNDVGAIDRAA